MTARISTHALSTATAGLSGAKRFAAAGAAALILSATAFPAHAADTTGTELQAILDSAIASSGGTVSGALLHVSHPEMGEWTLSAGTSDRETEAPLSPDAHFRAGSIMKPVLAALVMQLVEDGRLSLDATLSDLLPVEISGQFESGDDITLAMLLSHTGGIPEWINEDIMLAISGEPTRQWSDAEILASAAAQVPPFAPGAGWSYSNTDYTLVAMIVERTLGQPWRAAAMERVLSPLGLTDTLLPEPGDASMPADALHGYIDIGSGLVDITAVDPSMAGGAGGAALVTTTTDLADFFDSLRSGALFADPATYDDMLAFVPAAGPGGQDGYGLGLTHFTFEDGHELIGHSGGTAGYFSIVGYMPDLDVTIAVSQNLMSAYPDVILARVRELMDGKLAE